MSDDGCASTTWIESRQAMLKSACLPYGDGCLQNGNYVSISDGLLERRGLEVTQQFQLERFQILNRFEALTGGIRRRVIKLAQAHAAQPPAALFFFRPETN